MSCFPLRVYVAFPGLFVLLSVSPRVSMSLRVSNTPSRPSLRMVRTETRTQTTFDDAGRPVTKTVTERITTEADGSETREIVETED